VHKTTYTHLVELAQKATTGPENTGGQMTKQAFDQIAAGMRDAIAYAETHGQVTPVEFFGATAEAQAKASQLLGLASTGREQDWEIEFASPHRVVQILAIYGRAQPLDLRCALALLLVASTEQAHEAGSLPEADRAAVRAVITRDPEILARMTYYFVGLKLARNVEFIHTLVTPTPVA
jgi:hypothetical protein